MKRKQDNITNRDLMNNPQTDTLVLQTKIQKPANRKEFVKRQALISRLESNLSLPLTLISANTGCGKSVAVSQWLDETSHTYGWLSIDLEHNNTEVFLAYLIAILKQNWPDRSFNTEYLIEVANLPSNLIAATLIKDLDELDERFILVLDDYHLISEPKVHEIINGILRYPPAQFHLVIITQIDPPLKMAKLRAQFRLHELRMKDLILSPKEALGLRSLISKTITDNEVLAMLSYAEGWAAGFISGLMGLAEGLKIEKVTQALKNKGSVISNLLDEVVLNGLSNRTLKYLELTALLDRFSESLLVALIDELNDDELKQLAPSELIQNSKERNLFLTQLDPSGEWFRYHHFFKNQISNLIGKHFTPQELERLNKAASNWFEEHDFLEEALNYAMRSNDLAFAIDLFSRFRHKLLNSEQLQRLFRLTSHFPGEVINNNAELLINLAMLQHYNANFLRMKQYLGKAESCLQLNSINAAKETQLRGEFHGINTYFSYIQGDLEKAIYHGKKCMGLLPPETPNFFREHSVGWYAFAQQACGNAKEGMARLESEYRELANTEPYFKMRLLQGKLIFQLFEGNIRHLYHDGTSLAKICSPNSYPGSWVIGTYSMACNAYLQNQLENVATMQDELRKYKYACRPFWVIHHSFMGCLAAMAQKSWPVVERYLSECENLAEDLAIETLKGMVRAFRIEYYLRRNEENRARALAPLANFEPQPPTFFYYIPQLTQVKLCFRTDEKEKGAEMLQKLIETGKKRHNKNLLIQALALQAKISAEDGNTPAAHSSLNELLTLTSNTGHVRTYLDHGKVICQLLKESQKTTTHKKQVALLIKAFAQEERIHKQIKTQQGKQVAVIKLSKREREILALVTDGFKNEEIAEKLFISLDTVKKHLYRSYQKLEVNNRVSAIQKAESLGLMTT